MGQGSAGRPRRAVYMDENPWIEKSWKTKRSNLNRSSGNQPSSSMAGWRVFPGAAGAKRMKRNSQATVLVSHPHSSFPPESSGMPFIVPPRWTRSRLPRSQAPLLTTRPRHHFCRHFPRTARAFSGPISLPGCMVSRYGVMRRSEGWASCQWRASAPTAAQPGPTSAFLVAASALDNVGDQLRHEHVARVSNWAQGVSSSGRASSGLTRESCGL